MEKNYEQEFLRFYDQHADGIFRFCLFRVYQRETAKELTQETFLKTWEYLANGNQIKNIKSLAYKIARNLIIDYMRQNKPCISLEKMVESGFEPPDKQDLINNLDTKTKINELLTAVNNLEPIYREVITLRHLNGLKPKEIALIINENINVVSVRIHRGTKQLRQLLKI